MKFKLALILFAASILRLQAGTITLGVSTLPSFGNVYPFHSSTPLYYQLSASGLTTPLVIAAPAGFEVSSTFEYGYSATLTIVPQSGNIPTQFIYARFSPAAAGSASGNITHASTGSTTQNLAVSGVCIAWAIPANYYSTVGNQRGAALKTVLYNKITGHTVTSYTPGVWNAYYTTDVHPNGKVWDIYSTTLDTFPPYTFTLGTDQDNGSGGSVEGQKYNREHSFPQSWFNNASPMVSDIFHIYATDKKVNNVRSNFPYGLVNSPTYTSLIGGKLGPNTTAGFSGTVFEPVDEYKGDLARTYFYLATRYENLIGTWLGANYGNSSDILAGNSYPAFLPWQLNLLLDWNNLDPVSDKEIKRNNAVYAIQNNRNPFIDSPQLATKIWGGAIPNQPTIAASGVTVTNLSNNSVRLNWATGNGQRRLVLVRAGGPVNLLPTDTFHYAAGTALNTAPQLGSGNYIVYNGTGSTVTITNMLAGTNYYYAIVEYNGWYNTTNYNNSIVTTFNSVTMPVNLLYFKGLKEGDAVRLSWATAGERNNKNFEVQRSIDGLTFVTVGTVAGHGNSSVIRNYAWLDDMNDEPVLYYRLKQNDMNGSFHYSDIVEINDGKSIGDLVTILPNPFSTQIRISVAGEKEGVLSYRITDASGIIMTTGYENTNEHQNSEYLVNNMGNWPSGIYFMQVQYLNRNYSFKLIKK